MSHKLHRLRENLMEELERYSKDGEMTTGCLEAVYKLAESIKAIDTITAMEEYGEDEVEYSYRTRDSRGRYSGEGNSQRRSYNSYTDAKGHMISKLESMMLDTEDIKTRDILLNAINQLQR